MHLRKNHCSHFLVSLIYTVTSFGFSVYSQENVSRDLHSLQPPHKHMSHCTIVYRLETSTNSSDLELEQLPIIDLLPLLPVCQHSDCEIHVGPLCFRQDSRLFGGG